MDDNFFLEFQMLINLAEVSTEAQTVLDNIKRYFRKEAKGVLSRYGITMAYEAPAPKFMTENEYKSIELDYEWQVFSETRQGNKKMLASGRAASVSDANYYLNRIAYKKGARNYRSDQNIYWGNGLKISLVVKKRKNATPKNNG